MPALDFAGVLPPSELESLLARAWLDEVVEWWKAPTRGPPSETPEKEGSEAGHWWWETPRKKVRRR